MRWAYPVTECLDILDSPKLVCFYFCRSLGSSSLSIVKGCHQARGAAPSSKYNLLGIGSNKMRTHFDSEWTSGFRNRHDPTGGLNVLLILLLLRQNFLGVKCKYLEPEVSPQLKCVLILLLAIPRKLLFRSRGCAPCFWTPVDTA